MLLKDHKPDVGTEGSKNNNKLFYQGNSHPFGAP